MSLPLIGSITFAGRTSEEIAAEISRRWPTPLAHLRVVNLAAGSEPVSFSGALTRGGAMPFSPGLKLRELLAMAGTTEASDLEHVEIRTADGAVLIIDASAEGLDTELRSGDAVFVPILAKPKEVLVLGGVAKPGSQPFTAGMTARSAILAAGGANTSALRQGARVLREGAEFKRIDLAKDGDDVELKRGDVVQVAVANAQTSISVLGGVAHPGAVEYKKNMLLTQAIDAVGGCTLTGDVEVVLRRLIAPGAGMHRYSLNKIRSGQQKNVLLQATDVLLVAMAPKKEPARSNGKFRPVVPPR